MVPNFDGKVREESLRVICRRIRGFHDHEMVGTQREAGLLPDVRAQSNDLRAFVEDRIHSTATGNFDLNAA